jgi:hypothetical protein
VPKAIPSFPALGEGTVLTLLAVVLVLSCIALPARLKLHEEARQ